ncbi:MAG: beta galactosidase jelly roll domain-containing protein [Clostridia bacterium]|nr:beta galactosidase jelly roll domain-containing protein [Clostridia bacterium]
MLLILCMLLGMLSACSSSGVTDTPEVDDDPVTLVAAGDSQSMCIDQGWKVRADYSNVGIAEQWYNEVAGTDVEIPANASDVIEGWINTAWFTVEFESDLNVSSDERVYINLAAAGFVTKVWLNGIEVGEHTGIYGESVFDITDAIKHEGKNILAVYSSDAYSGYASNQIPTFVGLAKIGQPVYIYVKPNVSIADTYVHPSTEDGTVSVKVWLNNTGDQEVEAVLSAKINEKLKSMVIDSEDLKVTAPVGESVHELSLKVKNFKYWSPDDPQLYDVTINVSASNKTDEHTIRTGFKELYVDEDGYFVLNGERFYVKCTHAATFLPGSVDTAADLDTYYNLLLYLKSCGFNTIRYISSAALPQVLEMCAEIGLIVYEEHPMAWQKRDSDKVSEFFDLSVRDVLERDKNYVSLGMIGMLNETMGTEGQGTLALYGAAVGELASIREVAPHLLVMFGSGRWDGQKSIGSASNPYSSTWDGYMGNESADNEDPVSTDQYYAYVSGMGDVHFYPNFPIASEARDKFEEIVSTENAVFVSEFGMGSQANIIREYLSFDRNSMSTAGLPYAQLKQNVEEFRAFYEEYGLDSIWATPEAVLKATQEYQSNQRAYEFTMLRRNDNLNGFSTTMAYDSHFRGEGLMESEYAKVDATEMFQEAMSDLRFCITVENPHIWSGDALDLEVVVSDWGVLKDQEYPVVVRITSSNGTVWEKAVSIRPGDGDIIPVVDEVISTEGWEGGTYTVGAEFIQGAHANCGTLEFNIMDEDDIQPINKDVYVYGLSDDALAILKKYGANVIEYHLGDDIGANTLLLGKKYVSKKDRHYLDEAAAGGAHVVYLQYQILRSGKKIVLPVGEFYIGTALEWLYHHDDIVYDTDVTEGLQNNCILNAQYYDDIYSGSFILSDTAPDEVHFATFYAGVSLEGTGDLSAGYKLGTYQYGDGYITVNTLDLIDNINSPVATKILCNLARSIPESH